MDKSIGNTPKDLKKAKKLLANYLAYFKAQCNSSLDSIKLAKNESVWGVKLNNRGDKTLTKMNEYYLYTLNKFECWLNNDAERIIRQNEGTLNYIISLVIECKNNPTVDVIPKVLCDMCNDSMYGVNNRIWKANAEYILPTRQILDGLKEVCNCYINHEDEDLKRKVECLKRKNRIIKDSGDVERDEKICKFNHKLINAIFDEKVESLMPSILVFETTNRKLKTEQE